MNPNLHVPFYRRQPVRCNEIRGPYLLEGRALSVPKNNGTTGGRPST